MRRSDRLFDLIQILRDGELHRAADLGRQLGVSTRTIWRDMATLVSSGLPIEGERGVGYVMRAPVSLPPLALTREEFEALRLGMALVASGADRAVTIAANSLRSKIGAVTPQSMQDASSETFVYSTPEAARAAPHLGLIRRAIREHSYLELVYLGPGEPTETRRIRPLHLEFWGRVWTLAAWCETTGRFRMFRADLIASIRAEGGAFLPEPGKTLDDYLLQLTAH